MLKTVAIAAMWLATQPALAQQQFPLRDERRQTPTTSALLERFGEMARRHPAAHAVLAQSSDAYALVFVPGVLGSELKLDGKLIWPRLDPEQDQLRLPAVLIDETAPSNTDPRVSRLLYGRALDEFQARLKDHRIKFVPCGYDWRRDVRAGAQDLQDCLRRDAAGRRVIVVAHSMGGVVSWTWNRMRMENRWPDAPQLAGLAILGSPLGGSCEMLRMIQTGYVQPTDYTGYSEEDSFFERLGNSGARKFRELENALTEFFSRSLRAPC